MRKISDRHIPNTSVIIVAAGNGTRMNLGFNKLFAQICGRPLIGYTLAAFEESIHTKEVIIVTREEDIAFMYEIVNQEAAGKVKVIVSGGKNRTESVLCGLRECSDLAGCIAVHDGARPLILPEDIDNVIEASLDTGGAVLGVRVKDTVKRVDKSNIIIETPPRDDIWTVQTPQVFKKSILQAAYDVWLDNPFEATDDCMLVENIGCKIKIIEGSYDNIKITTIDDIYIAERILEEKVM